MTKIAQYANSRIEFYRVYIKESPKIRYVYLGLFVFVFLFICLLKRNLYKALLQASPFALPKSWSLNKAPNSKI